MFLRNGPRLYYFLTKPSITYSVNIKRSIPSHSYFLYPTFGQTESEKHKQKNQFVSTPSSSTTLLLSKMDKANVMLCKYCTSKWNNPKAVAPNGSFCERHGLFFIVNAKGKVEKYEATMKFFNFMVDEFDKEGKLICASYNCKGCPNANGKDHTHLLFGDDYAVHLPKEIRKDLKDVSSKYRK